MSPSIVYRKLGRYCSVSIMRRDLHVLRLAAQSDGLRGDNLELRCACKGSRPPVAYPVKLHVFV